MRILIAHEAPAGGGGVESYLAAIMPALVARGHQVAFLCDNPIAEDGPTRVDAAEMGVSVADAGLQAACARVRDWRPDVCFSHNMRRLEIDEALARLVPAVKMMHGYFGTCIGGQKAHAFPGITPCARTFGAPCLGLYLPRRCGQLRPVLMLEQYRWASIQNRMLNQYAHVVVASRHMAGEYRRHGLTAERLTVAPLFPTAGAAGPSRVPPSDPTVLFLGRMTRLKGGDVLIKAVAYATRLLGRPVRLLFAGNGPSEQSWRELAKRLAVDATFHGWVAGHERTSLLRSASLIAVPSLWPEPFGLVGLEAAAHGVPAVAFDVGGISEWLRDGVNGRLVGEPGSVEGMGTGIAEMLSAPASLARLGHGAVRAAASLSMAAHLDILEEVLGRARSQSRLQALA
jgi:glycosyltransferase involved in cell wall biosynthesis